MDKPNPEERRAIDRLIDSIEADQEEGLTGPQMAAVLKATLVDLVRQRASIAGANTVSSIVGKALEVRKQIIAENQQMNSFRSSRYF